jgi:retron-type reverse transcriptase
VPEQVGLSVDAVDWFQNDLSNRTQYVAQMGMKSEFRRLTKGVPQGSILGAILFTLYIHDIGKSVDPANPHLYADDKMIYSRASKSVC